MRRQPAVGEALSRVRLRIGPELAVVDIADTGVLIEGPFRLVPGARVDVHVITRKGRVLVRSTVSRSHIISVTAARVEYRAGLQFDQPVDCSSAEHG